MDDYVAFKFKAINARLLSTLERSEIFFARPGRLNDPFDCQVNILRALQRATESSTGAVRDRLEKLRSMSGFFAKVQRDLENVGVFSMCFDLRNSLMWSHYGDNHRGICLTYSLPESFFYENAGQILGVDRVKYGVNPLSEWFANEAPNIESFEAFGTALIVRALTVKAKPWEYENEVRIVSRSEGPQVLDKSYLKQVCFGLATPASDIAEVRSVVDRSGYGASLCKMERSPEGDFTIKAVNL